MVGVEVAQGALVPSCGGGRAVGAPVEPTTG